MLLETSSFSFADIIRSMLIWISAAAPLAVRTNTVHPE